MAKGDYFTAISCIDLEGTRNYFTARRSWLTTWFLSLSCPLYLVSNSSGQEETFAVQQQREASTGFASCPVVTFWHGTRTSGPEAGSTWKRMMIWIGYLTSLSLATSISATWEASLAVLDGPLASLAHSAGEPTTQRDQEITFMPSTYVGWWSAANQLLYRSGKRMHEPTVCNICHSRGLLPDAITTL